MVHGIGKTAKNINIGRMINYNDNDYIYQLSSLAVSSHIFQLICPVSTSEYMGGRSSKLVDRLGAE